MLSLNAVQTALVDSDNKTGRWAIHIKDINGVGYSYYSDAIGADGWATWLAWTTGISWSDGTGNNTVVVTDFSGIELRRNTSEAGIIAPSDITFSISNPDNTPDFTTFKGGTVLVELFLWNPTYGEHKINGWLFKTKTCEPGYQKLDFTCEDFLQDYLRGYYPNTRLPEDIFPSNRTYNGNMLCVPVPFGSAYIPLRDVFITDAGYLVLGDPARTYTIEKIRSPRSVGIKSEWDHASYSFTQSTKADADAVSWRVFQAIIADGNNDGVVDTYGWWGPAPMLDPPVLFSRDDTATMTNFADVIAFVLKDFGVPAAMIDEAGTFAACHTIFDNYTVPLVCNGAFWYKQDRQKVLSQLLTQCHSCLDVGETIKLRVLSKTSKATITGADILRTSEQGPGSFQYQDIVNEDLSDSAYGAYQETGEAQDELKKVLASTGGTATVISSEVIECPFVQDSRNVKRIVTLTIQRKLGKVASVNWLNKGTGIALQPDDVISINGSNYGGTYDVLIDSVKINKDGSINFGCTKFKQALSDWADLTPTTQVIPVDDTTHPWSPVISGPDSPGTPIPLNAIADRLRVGNGAANYILIEPADPRISLYNSGEKWRVGNLNGFLGIVTDIFGFGAGDHSANQANIYYDATAITGGLRLRSGTTNVINIDNAGNITISGGISASTISIGTSPNWFRVDASGNIWSGADTLALAQVDKFAVTNAGALSAKSGNVGGWTLAATTLTGTGITLSSAGDAYLAIGTTPPTSPTVGTGIFINKTGLFGLNANNPRFKILEDGSGFLGASTTIAWTSAGAVTVAGFTTDATDLTKTAGGNTTIVSSGATAFTAGPTGAPTFTVTQAGVLNATGVTVSGAITATSGTFTGTVNAADGYFGGATNGWVIAAGSLTAKGTSIFQTSATDATGIKIDSTSLRGYNGTIQTVNIATDGSGWVGLTGTKAISWTAAGAATIAGYTATATALYAGTTTTRIQLDTAAGIHLGATAFADAPFSVSLAGDLIATSATITGVITANTGKIGGADGWVISANYIKDVAGVTGLSSVVTAGDDIRFWAGHATPASAPFYVTEAGALVATSATITGAITATSGTFTGTINATAGKFGTSTNYWSVGATGLTATSASTDVMINFGKTDFTNTDTGFILGYDFSASAAKFLIGNSTSYLNWDGAALTYTKGTLVETTIQMYTNVATLKTSATAGDGSANSAGIVVTYEGLFGCGANQTATIAAADANVRILATGEAFFSGTITAGAGAIGGFTIGTDYIKDAADSFGLASTVTGGDDVRFWAGDTFANRATADFRITEAGALYASSATIVGDYKTSATVGTTKGIHLDVANNELYFYGDRGDTTIEKLASIGINLWNGDYVIGYFGTATSTRVGIYAESYSNTAIAAVSNTYIAVSATSQSNDAIHAVSLTGKGVYGYSSSSYGVYAASTSNYSLFVAGDTYMSRNLVLDGYIQALDGIHVGGTSDPGADNLIVDGTSLHTGIATFTANIIPTGDGTINFGDATHRIANIYTMDLNLCNDRGDYTLIEEEDGLTVRNNKTNKLYQINMTEMQ